MMTKKARKHGSLIDTYKRIRKSTPPPSIVRPDARRKLLDAITERELDEDESEEDTEA